MTDFLKIAFTRLKDKISIDNSYLNSRIFLKDLNADWFLAKTRKILSLGILISFRFIRYFKRRKWFLNTYSNWLLPEFPCFSVKNFVKFEILAGTEPPPALYKRRVLSILNSWSDFPGSIRINSLNLLQMQPIFN